MDGYIGEIRMFPYTFSNLQDWMPCDGRMLQIGQYQALAAVIGFTYGGDNRTIFALPNLQSLVPIGLGSIGLTNWTIGHKNPVQESVTLSYSNTPSHSHTVTAKMTPSANFATDMKSAPTNNAYLSRGIRKNPAAPGGYENVPMYNATMSAKGSLPDQTIGVSYGNPNGTVASHENRQPYLGMGFFICVQNGAFPVRN